MVNETLRDLAVQNTDAMITNSHPSENPYSQNLQPKSDLVVMDNSKEIIIRTKTGIPMNLIWIPYVSFSFIVVGLMLSSFFRYHRKHGHKYRQRQNEIWRQFNMQKLMNDMNQNQQNSPSHNHGHHHPPSGSMPPNGGVTTIHLEPSAGPSSYNVIQRSQNIVHYPPPSANAKTLTKDKKPGKRKRKPISFKSNLNGSMVDLRVGDVDNTKMFKTSFLLGLDNQVWTSSSTLQPPLLQSPTEFPETDDEDILLIHQTKV